MPKYLLKIKRSAEKELEALPHKIVLKIKAEVLSLAEDPFPPGHKKLKGLKNMSRIRVGDYLYYIPSNNYYRDFENRTS